MNQEERRKTLLDDDDNDTTTGQGATQQNEREAQTSGFSFFSGVDFYNSEETTEYLINNVIQREGLHIFYGESGCGKSFVMLDIACSIACTGITTWCEKPVEHGKVIYFVGESAKGMKKRFHCWCDERNISPDSVEIAFCDTPFRIDDARDKEHSTDELIKVLKNQFGNPALLIFDTLNVYLNGEESSNSDVGRFNAICKELIHELNCAVAIVHHTGLSSDAKTRERGASALRAGMDISMLVQNNNGIITLSNPKQKEDEKIKPIIFNLQQHIITGRFKKNGEPLTSCTVEYAKKLVEYRESMSEEKEAEKKKNKLPKAVRFARETYSEAAKQYGKIVVDDEATGHETIEVNIEDWRKVFYEKSSAESQDSKRAAFSTARKALLETQETRILTKRPKEGIEYYCLNLSGDTEPSYRAAIRTEIKLREKAEAEAQPEERTGNLFEETPR